MIKIFLITLSFLIVFFSNQVANAASDSKYPQETINPNSIFYPLKRSWEKLTLKIVSGDKKGINYENKLLNIRLSELDYVVKNKLLDEIQKSSERFSYQAGVTAEKAKQLEDQSYRKELLEKFKNYEPILSSLRDQNSANSSYWMLVQHSINTLKLLSEDLK